MLILIKKLLPEGLTMMTLSKTSKKKLKEHRIKILKSRHINMQSLRQQFGLFVK